MDSIGRSIGGSREVCYVCNCETAGSELTGSETGSSELGVREKGCSGRDFVIFLRAGEDFSGVEAF